MEDRTDRTTSGRFVRNLALSLTGGAVLTLVGAAAAHADEAGTASDGAGVTGTGDATAVGNRSGTTSGQTLAPSGGGGAPQVITQTAVVPNVGVAVANTGGNVAVGNASDNTADTDQTATGGAVLSSNSGEASNASDGSAWITTGDASAVGNESSTNVSQGASGALGLITTQNTLVLNAGIGVANTGLNASVGNGSINTAGLLQTATNTGGMASNSGTAANGSDGRATVVTGAASATGNKSDTTLAQSAGGDGDGDAGGLLVISQNSLVANAGLGVANTGGNAAIGNVSQNSANANQTATVDPTTETLLGSLASNSADVSTASDGTAEIHTGDAWAIGNDSNTNLTQTAHGDPSSLGGIVSTQAAGVLNIGVGAANTGINVAVGNASVQEAEVEQLNEVGDGASDIDALQVTASNSVMASAASDGTAGIHTGDASATGNASYTDLTQNADGTADGAGMVVNTQAGLVVNAGLGVANSGVNAALGNVSNNVAAAAQAATVAGDINTPLPLTSSNSANASASSDGTADVRTGDASATGNESETWFAQNATGTITEGSMGVVPNVQAAAVVNAGAGVANSGVNLAVGNASGILMQTPNVAVLEQEATLIPADTLNIIGPATVSNSADISVASDGTGKVDTGDATATGNSSFTALSQDLDATVDGMGVPVAPQLAAVINIGAGVANTGINASVGNASTSFTEVSQESNFDPAIATVVLGPVTVSNAGEASVESDGAACVCTGDATASGNVSRSTLAQDIDVTTDAGVVVVPTTGLILNAGFGLANSGVNLAIGNISTNEASAEQDSVLDPAAPALLVGPQTISTSGGASNSSAGTGEVGTGNATATGNESTSDLLQAATVDGSGVVAPINGAIANAGLGLANAGINLGVGNASTNSATLSQAASGTGTVSSAGMASNESDGTAQIGDPNCDDEKVTPPPVDEDDDQPRLPRTGSELETQAAVALMLLLAGFGLTTASRRRGAIA